MLTSDERTIGRLCWWRRGADVVRVRICGLGEGVLQVSIPPTRGLVPVPVDELHADALTAAGVVDLSGFGWRWAFDGGDAQAPALCGVHIFPCRPVARHDSVVELDDGTFVHGDCLASSCVMAHHLARARLFELRTDRQIPSGVFQSFARQLDEGAAALEPNVRGAERAEPGPRRYVVA